MPYRPNILEHIRKKLLIYIETANEVLYESGDIQTAIRNELVEDIHTYAYLNNHIIHKISNKLILSNWQNSTVPYFTNRTSGTTGPNFYYRIWSDIFKKIERDCHYGLINREFGINDDASICYLGLNTGHITDYKGITLKTKDLMLTHGLQKHTTIINPKEIMSHKLAETLYNHIHEQAYDVIITSGEFISPIAYLLKNDKIKPKKFNGLLSLTGNSTAVEDIRLLLDNNIWNKICDHMRCWDGGATFFSCKHGTKHLCDNLSSCSSNDDYKLISTDYFSLPNPFINYWNGDYAVILDSYEKCECGRYSRPFKLLAPEMSREFEWLLDIIGIENLKRFSFREGNLLIVVKSKLDRNKSKSLIERVDFPITVLVENDE